MKKMTKFLSIFLALTMVISMIPTSFAAEGEAVTADAGVTITYPISSQLAYSTGVSSPQDIKYTSIKSAGRMEWHLSNQTYPASYGSYALSIFTMSDAEYASFKIRVPAAGKYTVRQKFAYRDTGTKSNMYILDVGTTDIAAAIKSSTPVLTVDSYSKTVSTSADELKSENAPVVTAEWTAPAAGEYIVAWQGTGEYKNSMGRWYVAIGDLILDGNGTNRALIYADITAAKTELDAGIEEETTIALNSVFMSDGVAATDAEKAAITYESSEPEVAAVTGSTIKAISKGNATIYAKNGDYVLGEIDITVNDTAEAGVKMVYEFATFTDTGNYTTENLSYKTTGGRLQYVGTTSTVADCVKWYRNTARLLLKENNYAYFKINIPKAGKYTLNIKHGQQPSGTKGEMYLLPASTTDIEAAIQNATPTTVVDFYRETAMAYQETLAEHNAKCVVPSAGEYYMVWKTNGEKNSNNMWALYLGIITFDGGDGLAVMDAAFADHDKTLSVGDTTTVTAAGTLSNTSSMLKEGGAAKFTYASSNTNVATVDAATGEVIARSGGVAKITATCADAIDGYNSASTYIVVDEPSATVSFGFDSAVDGISITSDYTQGEVVSIPRETEIEVSAPPTADIGDKTYVFRGWVRGSADGGRLISLESTYRFAAITNTYLTAIYTEEAEQEYYAWNGEFLGTTKPESGSEPAVLGYSFTEWAESIVSERLTRFVAQYEQLSATYGVTYNGVTTRHKYDDEVTLSSDTAVYWYRDGKLIDYGTEYKFNVWDATVVTTSDEGHTLPKVILDDVIDNNYMIEYDAGDKTIIEAGILFSDAGTTPNINSCKEKIISQRSGIDHGQLTAKADYASARGYLVYKDGADYKVIYSE